MKKKRKIKGNKQLLWFVLPGTIWYLVMAYLPMFGVILAFKDYKINANQNFFMNLIQSPWVGFKNFEFLFKSIDAFIITRNTVLYNLVFITLGLVLPLILALLLSELLQKKMAKFYQSAMFLPYFLSWVVVSYCVFTFLSPDKGLVNTLLVTFNIDPVSWYNEPKFWPYILVFLNSWKNIGYNTVIFLAAISGIDKTYYEAASIDGASKFQQITKITIPLLAPVITILFILSIGNVFRADFGLFYQATLNSGPLLPVTNVIDTYVYRALMSTGDIALSSAAGLFQSVVGFILIISSNWIVKRFDKSRSMF